MTLRTAIAQRLFGDIIQARIKAAVKVIDDQYWMSITANGTQDKPWMNRQMDLTDVLDAWRVNPLARRIVALATDYVVGDGISLDSPSRTMRTFITTFWNHPQNHMDSRIRDLCDELTRAGELFISFFTNPADGMTYIRAVPACTIDAIASAPNDLEHELSIHQTTDDAKGVDWKTDDLIGPEMRHYAVNRPVGAVRGEGDLDPILPWLSDYKTFLKKRVVAAGAAAQTVFDITILGAEKQQCAARLLELKESGLDSTTIAVHNEKEEWSGLFPSPMNDAKSDAHAIRMMIAAGAGIPLHFLAEPESTNRATATEMNGPTFRHLYHRQLDFIRILIDIAKRAAERAQAVGKLAIPRKANITARVGELTKADNLMLAQSAKEIVTALEIAKRNNWCDDETAIRMMYKFAGEIVDVEELLAKIRGTQEVLP
jgi:hypothetical protein